jgi:hypothetical protein
LQSNGWHNRRDRGIVRECVFASFEEHLIEHVAGVQKKQILRVDCADRSGQRAVWRVHGRGVESGNHRLDERS